MNRPTVSVVIPVYNVEQYLPRCVDSVLNQQYEALEILLINDGSTDRSGEIAEEYARRDNRIRVIHQTNTGVSAARNKGIECATGEFITFVDSDDEILSDFLEVAVADCQKYELDLWIGTTVRVNENGEETGRNEPWEKFLAYTDELTEQQLLSVFNAVVCVSGKVWKRAVLENAFFDLTSNFGEDMQFALSLMLGHLRMLAEPKIVYKYHLLNTGLTASVNMKKCRSITQAHIFLYDQADKRGYPTSGAFYDFLNDRWCGNLTFAQTDIVKSNLSIGEKRIMLASLLQDDRLRKIASKQGFWYTHPFLREKRDYIVAAIETLQKDGVSMLMKRIKHFLSKRG